MTDNEMVSPEVQEDNSDDNLAARLDRFLASIIDTLIILVVILPIMFMTGGFDNFEEVSFIHSFSLGILGMFVFAAVNWNFLKNNGQTVGKKVMKIKVVTLDGELPQMGDHFLKRYAVYLLPGHVPVIGTIFSIVNVLFIFGAQRRCIHDLAGKTKVIKC